MKITLTKKEYELNKELFAGSIKSNCTEDELKSIDQAVTRSKEMYAGMYLVEEKEDEVIIHITEDMTVQILEKSKEVMPSMVQLLKDFLRMYIKWAGDISNIISKFIKY